MVNVTNRANVYVRLRPLELFSHCHSTSNQKEIKISNQHCCTEQNDGAHGQD